MLNRTSCHPTFLPVRKTHLLTLRKVGLAMKIGWVRRKSIVRSLKRALLFAT